MRVLRVGTSNDGAASLPPEQHAWYIAATWLSDEIGEPVETVLKRAWPNAALAVAVEEWMGEFQPDLVLLQVNNFWYAHESPTLWLQRRFGRTGTALTRAGVRMTKSDWFLESRTAIALSRAVARACPTATHFSVPEVVEAMESAMRKVLSHEGSVLLIRGHEHWTKLPGASANQNRRNTARNQAMEAAMRDLCSRLRVPYFQRPPVDPLELGTHLSPARFHRSAEGEKQVGEFEAQAMLATWRGASRTP